MMEASLRLNRNWQRALVAIAVVTVLAVMLAVPPVRAAARDLLGIFRMERLVVLPVTTGQIQNLENVERQLGYEFFPGSFETLAEPGEPQYVDSAAAAADAAGYAVRTPAALPPADEVIVRGEMAMRIVPDVALMQEIFRAANLDPALVPESIDGQQFDLTMHSSVVQLWNGTDEAVMFTQMPGPTAEFPDAVNEAELANAMLQLLGYAPEEAAALSTSIDWMTTLVLPLPVDEVDYQDVTVGGEQGVLLTGRSPSSDSEMPYGAVVWQQDGIVYVVAGQPDSARLLEIANSLQ